MITISISSKTNELEKSLGFKLNSLYNLCNNSDSPTKYFAVLSYLRFKYTDEDHKFYFYGYKEEFLNELNNLVKDCKSEDEVYEDAVNLIKDDFENWFSQCPDSVFKTYVDEDDICREYTTYELDMDEFLDDGHIFRCFDNNSHRYYYIYDE